MITDIVRADIMDAAQAHGLRIVPIVRTYEYEYTPGYAYELQSSLNIQGHTCFLSSLTAQAKNRYPGAYTRFSYGMLSRYDAVIAHVALPEQPVHIFVLPALSLRDHLFRDNTRDMMRVFLPTGPGRRPAKRGDLSVYKNAWHLLEEEQQTQAA